MRILSGVGLLAGHRQSRRGGGGVERGGDPWVAPGGGTIPGLGDPRGPERPRGAQRALRGLVLEADGPVDAL